MKRIKSLSDKRIIVEGRVNNESAYFLADTGASIAILDYDKRKKYDLKVGRKFNGTIVGAGGEMRNLRHCDTFAYIEDRALTQFVLADISDVVKSMKRETGVEILGIISLPQMKLIGMNIDANSNEFWFE